MENRPLVRNSGAERRGDRGRSADGAGLLPDGPALQLV